MNRRDFVIGAVIAAAYPEFVHAQKAAIPTIGILGSPTAESYASRTGAFMQGLKETGFLKDQNVAIEIRWANDEYSRLPDMAADLVRTQVSLIAAMGNYLPTRAAMNATTTIPIVFMMGADPVQLGLVASLNRPGGNVTGITALAADQIQKRVQLLHDLVPNARIFGLLINPDNDSPASSAGRTAVDLVQDAVHAWGGTIHIAYARKIGEFDAAFASILAKGIEALVTASDALFISGRERLVALAAQKAIPTIFVSPEAAKDGGLMSYSTSAADIGHQAGVYAGRILKGEKPADLPVQLATKFELIVNLKTAKALGLTIPRDFLLLADEVIE
jgi:putative tryptophan/tyrosine transport system substrate-binding protein